MSDFTAKSVETAGEQLASKIRDSVRHNIPTLGASLRALRIAAVEKKAVPIARNEITIHTAMRPNVFGGSNSKSRQAVGSGSESSRGTPSARVLIEGRFSLARSIVAAETAFFNLIPA